MGGELAPIVERLNENWNRGIAEGVEIERMVTADIDLIDPDFEYVNPPQAIDSGIRHGVDGLITAITNLREVLGIYRVEIERAEEDDERVALALVLHGRAPGSGIEMAYPARGAVWTFRDRRVARMEWFITPEEAFARLERR